jgi:type I restriction enzyme, S subunit
LSERNELPEGWTWARLGDVASPGYKRNPKADGEGEFLYIDVEALDNSAQRIVAPKRLRNSEAPSRARVEIKGGDVLFSLVRPYLKNVARVPEELDGQIASTAYCLVRPASGVRFSYLFHFLTQESVINALPTYGNSPPAARDEEFYAMLIPMSPTDEQRRIVAAIEEQFSRLDAGVAALERVRTNLKRYRTAVLKAAVEGRLTETWREENPDVEPASELLDRILKERRERWEKDQLAAYEKKGKKPPKNWRSRYKEPVGPNTEDPPKLPERWTQATVAQLAL